MSTSTPIEIVDNPDAGRFETIVEGHLAIAQYVLDGNVITFTHTEVPPALGGRGIATRLVEAGLASARERGLSVVPVCGVFQHYLKKHPEAQDLLQADTRSALGIAG